MSKSLLYASNTVSQTVSSTSTVLNIGTAVRKYGCSIKLSGSNIVLADSGFYDVYTNLTFEASAAGTVQVQLYKNGTAIPGASASFTVAEGSTYAVSVPCVVRNTCCCESILTIVISGVAGAINTVSAVVKK